jgi:2-aminoadipate transaminase
MDRLSSSPSSLRAVGKSQLPISQFVSRPGIIDLGWGHPEPDLLPIAGLGQAALRVLERYGPDALNYGYAGGPGPLIAWVCQRLSEVDAAAPTPDCVVASAGNSQALDQIATLLTASGDAVLVEAPTYHLAVRILQDHHVDLVPVPADRFGLRVDVLAHTVRQLRAQHRRVRFLYTIPTFHNPTGASLANERRRELIEFAETEELLVIEDDAYRELSYDGAAPPSLWSLASRGAVIRLGSFAKSLAPGLRTGFITADATFAGRMRDSGLLDSGGGISHFSSLMVAEFAATGEYVRNVEKLRKAYTERRDALLTALSHQLDGRATWLQPAGGYFVWVTLPPGRDASALLPQAEANGTSYLPGSTFYLEAGEGVRSLRLAFSRCGHEELVEAVRRLGLTLSGATVRSGPSAI